MPRRWEAKDLSASWTLTGIPILFHGTALPAVGSRLIRMELLDTDRDEEVFNFTVAGSLIVPPAIVDDGDPTGFDKSSGWTEKNQIPRFAGGPSFDSRQFLCWTRNVDGCILS